MDDLLQLTSFGTDFITQLMAGTSSSCFHYVLVTFNPITNRDGPVQPTRVRKAPHHAANLPQQKHFTEQNYGTPTSEILELIKFPPKCLFGIKQLSHPQPLLANVLTCPAVSNMSSPTTSPSISASMRYASSVCTVHIYEVGACTYVRQHICICMCMEVCV